jgi:hypothetical protein
MTCSLLLAALLLAGPPVAAKAPTGPVVIETKRGKLEFSHQAHAKTACATCHKGEGPPGRLGLKGRDAAHKYCVDCHKAEKKGPVGCNTCHQVGPPSPSGAPPRK